MRKTKLAFLSLSLLVIAVGIFVRFWQLEEIPPGIQYDEAYNGLNALTAGETGQYKIFYTDNFGREGLHINTEALIIKFFGVSNASLRYANALWGTLALVGFYFLLRQLKFSRPSVIAGMFFLAFSFWHLDFSRTAYRAIMVPFLLIWIFYFFLKGLESEKHKNGYLAIAGILLGLGFHTYISFRAVPLIFVILAIVYTLTIKGFFKKYWKGALIFFTCSLTIALPILVYFYSHQNDMVGRSEKVSIFDDPNTSHWEDFKKSLVAHLGVFFVHGDNNPRFNYNSQPLLPVPWAILFVLGFMLCGKEIVKPVLNFRKGGRKKLGLEDKPFSRNRLFYISVLAQSTFWVMLIPGVLSIEGIPHTLRIIGTIPAVFLFCALALEYIFNLYKKAVKLPFKLAIRTAIVGFIVLVVYFGLWQSYVYFEIWAKDARTFGAYERKLYELGELIRELPLHNNNYLITAYNTAVSKDNLDSSLKTAQYVGYPKIKSYLYLRPLPGRGSISCDDPLIIFQESDQWLRNEYQQACPNLKASAVTIKDGKFVFWVMKE